MHPATVQEDKRTRSTQIKRTTNANTEQMADTVATADERQRKAHGRHTDQERAEPRNGSSSSINKDEGMHIKKSRMKKKLKLQLRTTMLKSVRHRTGAGTSSLEKASGSS